MYFVEMPSISLRRGSRELLARKVFVFWSVVASLWTVGLVVEGVSMSSP